MPETREQVFEALLQDWESGEGLLNMDLSTDSVASTKKLERDVAMWRGRWARAEAENQEATGAFLESWQRIDAELDAAEAERDALRAQLAEAVALLRDSFDFVGSWDDANAFLAKQEAK